jgi:transcriptional regulator with XRE-family HTH domain
MIGHRFKELRHNKGITQEYLSKVSGVSTSMISAIENARRQPTVDVAIALAKGLHTPIEKILHE